MKSKHNSYKNTRETVHAATTVALGAAVMLLYRKNTLLKEQARESAERSNTDPLTGLGNRRVLEATFEGLHNAHHNRATDAPEEKPHSLVLIDLDGFKGANDVYGHNAGDKVLKGVAAAAKQNVRERDVVVRQGGDEFALILPRSDSENSALVAEKVRAAIESSNGVGVTASIGVSELDMDMTLEENLHMADQAAYAAKTAGKNQVVRYDEL